MRIAAAVEYVGSGYAGWQKQNHAVTVQGCLEKALGQIANTPVELVCAGRTDAGVHAVGQVVHFDTVARRSDTSWLFGTNALLPADISLTWVQEVPEDFHARFSATSRRYRYFIHDSHARSALLGGRVAWSKRTLHAEVMHEAAQYLLGEQDFSAFRAAECQSNSAMRCVKEISVYRWNEMICLDIQANAFLHHMVRNIAGSLIEVGAGKRGPEWIFEVMKSKDRNRAGPTAVADGLYLVSVAYPEQFNLPKTGTTAFFPDH